jgi:hypothetical protein
MPESSPDTILPRALPEIELTPEQIFIVNDMIHAWIEDKREYRQAFRNDCKRLLATVKSDAAQYTDDPRLAHRVPFDVMDTIDPDYAQSFERPVKSSGTAGAVEASKFEGPKMPGLAKIAREAHASMFPPPAPDPAPDAVREALDRIPAHINFLIGRGKTRPDEPPYGVQILDGLKIVAEAEGDDLCATINEALAALTPDARSRG